MTDTAAPRAIDTRPATLTKTRAEPRTARMRRAAHRARIITTHDRTKTAARVAARHTLYVAGGGRIMMRRTWDGRSAARYERMMRTAEAAGKHDVAMEWEERGRAFRAARHQRRMDLLAAPQRIAKGAAVGTATTTAGLLGLGAILAFATHDPHQLLVPAEVVIEGIRWAAAIGLIVWGLLPWLLPVAIIS